MREDGTQAVRLVNPLLVQVILRQCSGVGGVTGGGCSGDGGLQRRNSHSVQVSLSLSHACTHTQ